MQIWSIRNEGAAPQHIGNCNGMADLSEMIAKGRKAGHYIEAAAYAVKGNDATCYVFTKVERLETFFAYNPDIRITSKAVA